jgi:tetratricopeptide (TPR) repeat protein
MEKNTEGLLVQAKNHFFALRLLEAYTIFRRFFDRIPFKPELGHAEYIGMFARVLAELGKTHELRFYMSELERWKEKTGDPAISYQLGIVYCYLPEPKFEKAKQIFEQIILDPSAQEYRIKARIMLADYYDDKKDIVACRRLIFSIDPKTVSDTSLALMVDVWRAKILRDEGNFVESRQILDEIFKKVTPETNWYVFWNSKLILARLYFLEGNRVAGQDILRDVKRFLKHTRCRSLEKAVPHLETLAESYKKNPRAHHVGKPGNRGLGGKKTSGVFELSRSAHVTE